MNIGSKELLESCVYGRNTLDKQELMNIICSVLEVECVDVRITPGDVLRLGEQMIADA